MRFLLDEGLPYRLTAFLIALGHEVTAVGREYPSALADRAILAIALAERRIIPTNDEDFGDLVVRDKIPHAGVILFRLGYVSLDERIALMRRVLAEHADELDRFIVVTRTSLRVHPS